LDGQEGNSAVTILFTIFVILLAGSAILLINQLQVRLLDARVAKVINGRQSEHASPSLRQVIIKVLANIGSRYRRFYSPENLDQLRTIVQTAGFNPYHTMPILIGGKTVSMFAFPLMTYFLSLQSEWNSRLAMMLMATVVGIMAPRFILRVLAGRFNAAVERGMPDAIDLLVVCGDAGMGLESGLERVGQEMTRSNPAMSRVISGLLDDLRVMPDRREAFQNLALRSTSEGLRRFGTMINQSLQYGTPLNDTLRAVSNEMRRDCLIKLEERAHKLGAKLIIPMVIFMLPAMFIILAGSPFLHLMKTMTAIGH
jgi:tight adherence protein C